MQTNVNKLYETGSYSATDGQYFGYLSAGAGANTYTMLSQDFTVQVGDTLSFDAFFDAGDYLPFNDNGFVEVINTSDSIATADCTPLTVCDLPLHVFPSYSLVYTS